MSAPTNIPALSTISVTLDVSGHLLGSGLNLFSNNTGLAYNALSGLFNNITNPLFSSGNQTFTGLLDIRPTALTSAQQTFYQSTSPASVLLMSGVPVLLRQSGWITTVMDSNGYVFLNNVNISGNNTNAQYIHTTELTACNNSGAQAFITLDTFNSGVISMGNRNNMQTLNILSGMVGVINTMPQFPLDVPTIGNSSGALLITTPNMTISQVYQNASGIYVVGGQGFASSGGLVYLQGGIDSQGYLPQSPVLINTNGGNVGIGNSNPQYTLDVLGSGNFSQGIYLSGHQYLTGFNSGQYVLASNTGILTGVFVNKGNSNVFAIPSGAISVTVSGINFSSVPRGIMTSVNSPNSNGQLLWSSADISTITATGFTANLNGPTDSTGYLLAYLAII